MDQESRIGFGERLERESHSAVKPSVNFCHAVVNCAALLMYDTAMRVKFPMGVCHPTVENVGNVLRSKALHV